MCSHPPMEKPAQPTPRQAEPGHVSAVCRRCVDRMEIDDPVPESLRVPMPVIRDQLGHSFLAVTGHYLRNIAPAQVITTMQQTEPPASRAANPAQVNFTRCTI